MHPVISRRRLADLRKATLIAGEVWPHDTVKKVVPERAPKGHKRHRRLDARLG
jgi:hypothetical protein